MLLHLEGVLDHDESIADFLHRRGYGRNGRNLSREYQGRAGTPPGRPADPPRIQPGQLTRIAHRVGADVLKRPVTVGSEHCNRLQHVRAPKKPGVYVFSEGGRPVFVGRISNLYNRATLIASAAGSTDASEFMAGACGDWTSDESLSPEARELIETRSKEVVGEAFKQLLAAAFASAFSDDGRNSTSRSRKVWSTQSLQGSIGPAWTSRLASEAP